MPISFSNIPSNLRTPLFYAEMDNSQANSATTSQITLLIGQQLSTATQTAGEPFLASSASVVGGICGYGSMIHNMMTAYLANDTAGEIYILPLADASSSVNATGSITVNSPPTDSGTLNLYIAGTRVQVAVVSTDTNAAIATAIAAAITANTALPVTATASAGVVSLTAKNAGALGSLIDIRYNYLGTAGGETTPAGYTSTIVAMNGGSGTPSLEDALANLGDKPFDFIINPYTDTASLDSIKSFLSDSTGRWSYSSQQYGHSLGFYSEHMAN